MDARSSSLSRRRLLGGALAAGAAGALGGVPGLASAAGATKSGGAGPEKRAATVFFKEERLNFQMLFALGGAGYGVSEVGEVLATFDRIHGKGDTYRATFEEFLRLGLRTRVRADEEHAAGRTASARSSYLRAAMYLDQALFFVLASKSPTRRHEGIIYKEMEAAWARAGALFQPRFEPVTIPWEGGTLPGWFLSPGGKGPRPTVILNNGSDAQNIDMYVYGGAAALERGWNALILEGPGQGANLFLRNQVFIPQWERVITPVVDFLRSRGDVDRRRISLIGQSFGGYLVARAATHEHRLAALVCDTGVTDVFSDWQHELPGFMLKLLQEGRATEFDRVWDEIPTKVSEADRFSIAKRSEIYGNGGGYERMTNARRFVLSRAEARRIPMPTAITAPELEASFTGQQEQLHRWIGKSSTLIPFTVAEGAEYHCEPMAPQLRNERVFDWLETHAQPVKA
ncbi:MAG: prolyl oligopeptidase family serine peptidase [Actinobacteria bacterium]|nr:prolyl oligopeptidase family serine peptidase [Actinomycetota bacterium]